MNLRRMVSSALIAAALASSFPVTAAASVDYDLRKRVIELTGIFKPTDGSRSVTRGEFADMLVKASEYRESLSAAAGVSVFSDVFSEYEYASAIRIAVRQGWMKAYLGGKFKPDEYIVMQDGMRAVLAMLGYTDEDFSGDQNGSRLAKFEYLGLNNEMEWVGLSEVLTEDNCLNLFYNLLKAKPKNSQNIYGSVLDLTLSSDGEISPLEMLDISVKGPYIVKKSRSMSTYLPFNTDKASFFLNGKPCTWANVKAVLKEYKYVVMYYNSSSKTVWVYSENGNDMTGQIVLQGQITNIYYRSSDVMTPTAITLTDDDEEEYYCSLTTSDLQFAFSIYGTVEVGDDVILICSGSSEDQDGGITYRVTDFAED